VDGGDNVWDTARAGYESVNKVFDLFSVGWHKFMTLKGISFDHSYDRNVNIQEEQMAVNLETLKNLFFTDESFREIFAEKVHKHAESLKKLERMVKADTESKLLSYNVEKDKGRFAIAAVVNLIQTGNKLKVLIAEDYGVRKYLESLSTKGSFVVAQIKAFEEV